MLLYKREVPGGALPLWFPMEPYRGGGALKASAPLEIPTINPAARSASEPNPRRLGLPMPARVGAVSRIRPVRCPALAYARYGTVGVDGRDSPWNYSRC